MPTRDPQIRRYLCPWCGRPNMWPDGCSETVDAPVTGCAAHIEEACETGDHRRCGPDNCVVAARWHAPVREAGMAAGNAAGALWVVVSTLENRVDVVGTTDNLGRAKSILAGTLRRAGRPYNPEGLGLVYVVRAADGGFL